MMGKIPRDHKTFEGGVLLLSTILTQIAEIWGLSVFVSEINIILKVPIPRFSEIKLLTSMNLGFADLSF